MTFRLPQLLLFTICVSLMAPALPAQEDRWKELTQQVVALFRERKFQQAIEPAEESLRIAESTFGPDHEAVGTSLNNLANVYEAMNRYAEAESLHLRAIAVWEKQPGESRDSLARSLNNLAQVYRRLSRLAEAEAAYLRSLAIWEAALGPDDIEVAAATNNLAGLYREQGRFDEAERLYERSLIIREKKLGTTHPMVAQSSNNLAVLYATQGRYAKAELAYKRALDIHEANLPPEHPALAGPLGNLAGLLYEQGRIPEALALFRRSLAITEKAMGPDHMDVANTLNNLAIVHRAIGQSAEAERYYQRALAIAEKVVGPDHPEVARSLANLGLISQEMGRYEDSQRFFDRALGIQEKTLGPDHLEVAATVNNLALLYRSLERFDEAEQLFKKALSIREKRLGPEHNAVAAILTNLGSLYYDQRRLAEAEALFQRSLMIKEKALGSEHNDVAISLNNLAALFHRQERYHEAEPLYERARAIHEKGRGLDHPETTAVISNQARLRFSQGRFAEAQPLFEQAFSNLRAQFDYHFAYMSEKDRLSFLQTVADSFSRYYSFCYQFYQRDPALTGKMFDVVLWQKGFVGQSVAALRARIAAQGNEDALGLLEKVAAAKTQLARLLLAPVDRLPTAKLLARRAWIKDLTEEVNSLERSMVERAGSLAQDWRLSRVTWQEVQRSLKETEATVEFVRFRFYDGREWTGQTHYVALVLTRSSPLPVLVRLGDAAGIESAPIEQFRERMVNRGEAERPSPKVGTQPRRADSLFASVWQPLVGALRGKKRIYVAPDGVLNTLSFGVMQGPGGRLLMETVDVRVVVSSRSILTPVRLSPEKSAVLVGNPLFAGPIDGTLAASPASSASETAGAQPIRKLLSRNMQGTPLPPLANTQKEIDQISRLLMARGWTTQVYAGSDATEELVKGVRSPRLLHLATHGFFLPNQPQHDPERGSASLTRTTSAQEEPMLRSGLFLAGASASLNGKPLPEGLDDGILTAFEAADLDLHQTELVTLSACETGLGNIQNGEGVFGLRRALQVAGAQSILMTMWSVPDRETQELMERFYRKWLGGLDKHLALRQAQMEMRTLVARRYGRDMPYYWGAFVLIGP